MKSKRYLYGLMGLLSLLGLIGIFTEAKSFLAFFAFAVDFEYFFIKSDEMLEEYMNKSASRAFYCGMISVALVSFVCFFAKNGGWRMIKNRIKEYRAKYDMKQEDLAKLVGVRRETIGNLEKGRYNPSLVLAWNIAKVFNVSIEDIFTVED